MEEQRLAHHKSVGYSEQDVKKDNELQRLVNKGGIVGAKAELEQFEISAKYPTFQKMAFAGFMNKKKKHLREKIKNYEKQKNTPKISKQEIAKIEKERKQRTIADRKRKKALKNKSGTEITLGGVAIAGVAIAGTIAALGNLSSTKPERSCKTRCNKIYENALLQCKGLKDSIGGAPLGLGQRLSKCRMNRRSENNQCLKGCN